MSSCLASEKKKERKRSIKKYQGGLASETQRDRDTHSVRQRQTDRHKTRVRFLY